MLQEINNLREIARRCAAGETLDDQLSRWLASGLEKYLTHCCAHLDDAFGLKSDQGGVPWWMEDAIRVRNAALCDLAEILRPASSISALVREIHKLMVRYEASAWRHDRSLDVAPPSYAGTPKEQLWHAFKSGAPMPLGERQLRNIIG